MDYRNCINDQVKRPQLIRYSKKRVFRTNIPLTFRFIMSKTYETDTNYYRYYTKQKGLPSLLHLVSRFGIPVSTLPSSPSCTGPVYKKFLPETTGSSRQQYNITRTSERSPFVQRFRREDEKKKKENSLYNVPFTVYVTTRM